MSRKLILALLACLGAAAGAIALAVTLTSTPVKASEHLKTEHEAVRGSASVTIAAEIRAEGFVPEDPAGYILRLSAEDGAPLPEDGAEYDLRVKGPGKAVFPPITFNALGTYHYHLRLLPGKDSGAVWDETRYDLTITVLRDESTGEWYTMLSIRYADTQRKTDVPLFVVKYTEPPETPGLGIEFNHVGDTFD